MLIHLPPRILPEPMAALIASIAALREGEVAVLRAPQPEPFCLGMDLDAYAANALDAVREPLQSYRDCLLALRQAPCPTVAVVEGAAMGGGLGLASVCDVVLATPEARFGLPEATFGLVPGMVFAVMADRVSPARLRRMALQGDSVGAEQAAAWGLVDEVIDPAALERAVARWVRRLSRLAPGAAQAVRSAVDSTVSERLDRGLDLTAGLLERPDVHDRVRRFMREGVAPWDPLEQGR